MQTPPQMATAIPHGPMARNTRSVSPALALLPLGFALFHSSYEISVGPVALNLELIAITFAWFFALLRSPVLSPLLSFLSYFLVIAVGVTLNVFRSGEFASLLYFVQAMLFMSVALLPAALTLSKRECRWVVIVFLALFLIKLAMTNLSFGGATSDYNSSTQFTFNIQGQAVRRAAILNFHANAFALTATIMTLYALAIYLFTNNRYALLFYALYVGLTVNVVLLTFSRSGFISFSIATIIALAAIQSKRSVRLGALIIAGVIIFGVLLLVTDNVLMNYFFEQRMENIAGQASENKRIGFVQHAASDWAQAGPFDWIFGSGFMHHYTDSAWPAILFNLGFIGVAVFLTAMTVIGKCVLHIWRTKKDSAILLVSILSAIFLYGFSTEFWAVRKVLAPAALLFGIVYYEARLGRRRYGTRDRTTTPPRSPLQ